MITNGTLLYQLSCLADRIPGTHEDMAVAGQVSPWLLFSAVLSRSKRGMLRVALIKVQWCGAPKGLLFGDFAACKDNDMGVECYILSGGLLLQLE